MAWLLLSLRRLRGERVPALGLAALVLVTAFVFALAPRLLDRVADTSLRDEVRAAHPAVANIQLLREWRIEPGDTTGADPLGPVAETGKDLEADLPGSIEALVVDRGSVIDSPRWAIRAPTSDPAFARLTIQEAIADHIQYVAGRAPTGQTRLVADVSPTAEPGATIVSVEVALSAESARALDLAVGDLVNLELDPSDPLVGRGAPELRMAIEIVGTYDAPDDTERYWLDDTALIRPSIRSLSGDVKFIDVGAVVAPDAYPALVQITDDFHPPFRYTWRYYLDPEDQRVR